MLKQAFTYARQQGWASPNVLQLVDRCNKAGVVENWCMVSLCQRVILRWVFRHCLFVSSYLQIRFSSPQFRVIDFL